MPHDLVITGGTVVDGTGAPPRQADVAIDGDRITAVGNGTGVGEARRYVDADGAVVTPGFVDVHTHYDGQATWDEHITPSAWHGVTTVVMGNCGVGFAPVRPADHDVLVELMEGVEDIPGTALHEGLEWNWESCPDFLDALERQRRDVDIGSQVPTRPEGWRSLLDAITAANDRGLKVSAQVAARPVGILLGLQATINPLGASPTARSLGADVDALRRDDVRARILSEMRGHSPLFPWDHVFYLGDPPDYEPPPEASIAAAAVRTGTPAEELVYDAALADDGTGLLYVPFLNYADGDLEAVRAMLTHPHAVLGLADGGAHVGTICDGSFTTTMLAHWVRDRTR